MKKILSIALVMLFAFSMSAQDIGEAPQSGRIFKKEKINKLNIPARNPKADVILSEDFSDGALPTGWQNVDNNGNGEVWRFDNPGNRTINTTTASNGFAIFDSDYDGNDGHAEDCDLITPVMDCSSNTKVFLQFEHFFMEGYGGGALVAVSGDNGSTWDTIALWHPSSTDNAQLERYDISSLAAGNSQVLVKFNWTGDYSYFWAVDDIVVFEPYDNDLSVTSVFPSPVAKKGDTLSPSVTVYNIGTVTQDDFNVKVVINDGATDVYTSTLNVTGAGLASFADSTFVMNDSWTPDVGTYTITASVTLTGDDDNSNDTMVVSCDVVDFTAFSATAYTGNTTSGTYSEIDLSTGALGSVGTINNSPFPMAEEYNGQYIYRVNSDGTIGVVASDGTYLELGTLSGVDGMPTGLAWDWNTSQMYVILLDNSNLPHLCTVDLNTFGLTQVGTGTATIIGIDFADDGYIYGPSLSDSLYKYDPSTGAETLIGALGINISYGQDVTFDIATGNLYTITASDTTAFGTYDLSTGAFTQIADKTGEGQYATLVSLSEPPTYTVTFTVDDGTNPIEGANVVVSVDGNEFANDSTDSAGKMTFDAPADSYTYTVSADGYQSENGTFDVVDTAVDVHVVLVVTAINTIDADVSIYPSPTSGLITVKANGNYTIDVLDITGKVINTFNMTNVAHIDIAEYKTGIYFVRLSNKNGTATYKVVKE